MLPVLDSVFWDIVLGVLLSIFGVIAITSTIEVSMKQRKKDVLLFKVECCASNLKGLVKSQKFVEMSKLKTENPNHSRKGSMSV